MPVAGSGYLRQLMSPIPISTLARLSGSLTDPAPIYNALMSSVNGIHNPDFLFPSMEPDPRFNRIVTIIADLTRMYRLHWVAAPEPADSFSIVIDRADVTNGAQVEELLSLLGLPQPDDNSTTIDLPVSLALHGRESSGVAIITRSVYDLAEILAAAVEVPERDQGDGAAADYPRPGPVGSTLRIRRSADRPDRAAVTVPYRDGWFYIDDRDRATKGFFRLLASLWSVAIADTTAGAAAAPVLTVPVSR